jgi:PST family polysaccharide transporter
MFKDAGLSMATIQREKISQSQVSTLFWLNVLFSTVIATSIICIAPAISWFYGEARLTRITIILAIPLFISGLAIQHQAILRRQMRFGILGFIDALSLAVGAGIGIIMATCGYKYWSLVGMLTGTTLASSLGSFIACAWIPSLRFDLMDAWSLITYGGHYSLSAFANYFIRQGDDTIIGWRFGATELGFYSRGFTLLLQPWQQLLAPISSVVEPALCRSVAERGEFKKLYATALHISALVTFPLAILMYACATPIVEGFLGHKWYPVVPILECLIPAALLGGVKTSIGWLLFPTGDSKGMFKWNCIAALIAVIAFGVGSQFHTIGVAVSVSLLEAAFFFFGSRFAAKRTRFSPSPAFGAILLPLYSAVVGSIAIIPIANSAARGVLAISCFAATYLVLSRMIGTTIQGEQVGWPFPRLGKKIWDKSKTS